MTTGRKRPEGAPACAPAPGKTNPKFTKAGFQKKAQGHVLDALETLATLAQSANSEAVRVSAANAVLDRALGKPVSGARAGSASENGETAPGSLEVQWLDAEKS